jgi:hypothetical protein
MELLSERYGWTPAEIRAQSREDILSYLHIIRIKRKLENNASKAHGTKRA